MPKYMCEQCGTAKAVGQCSGCHVACYCSRECQERAWRRHHSRVCTMRELVTTTAVGEGLSNLELSEMANRSRPLNYSETRLLYSHLRRNIVAVFLDGPPRQFYVITAPPSRVRDAQRQHLRLLMSNKGIYFYAAPQEQISPYTKRPMKTWITMFANVLNRHDVFTQAVNYYYDRNKEWKAGGGGGGGSTTTEQRKQEKQVEKRTLVAAGGGHG